MHAIALIAEDEPLLAAGLKAELARQWPELEVVSTVSHGQAAVEQALALLPDLVFLDIRMPGLSGLEAARSITEDWPDGRALPMIVFVTAYDEYAVPAFEQAALDYVLKPVTPDRLRQSCHRLQEALTLRRTALPDRDDNGTNRDGLSEGVTRPTHPTLDVEAGLAQLRLLLASPALLGTPQALPPRLTVIQASVGAAIQMVPIGDVIYFEAADKYVRVVTAEREHLIRTPLKELLPQLDPQCFWQVHRGTVVQATCITSARRDESGKVFLTLRGRTETIAASRLYAHLFKGM